MVWDAIKVNGDIILPGDWNDFVTAFKTHKQDWHPDTVVDAAGEGDYTTIQAALDAGKKEIQIKDGTYAPIAIVNDYIRLFGSSRENTIIKATGAIGRVLDARNRKGIHLENLRVHGNKLGTIGIDMSNTASAARQHMLSNVVAIGALTSNIDLSGAEDTALEKVYVDGHGVEGDPGPTTENGIVCGGTGGIGTAGCLTFHEVISGFHKTTDVWAKKVEHLRVFGGVLASTPDFSPVMKSELLIDDSGLIELFGAWFEGYDAPSTVPNILIENNPVRDLGLFGVRAFGNQHPNIYSTLVAPNRAAWCLHTHGGVLEPRGVNKHAIQCPAYHLKVESTDLVCSAGFDVDATNVAYYSIDKRESTTILINKIMNYLVGGVGILNIEATGISLVNNKVFNNLKLGSAMDADGQSIAGTAIIQAKAATNTYLKYAAGQSAGIVSDIGGWDLEAKTLEIGIGKNLNFNDNRVKNPKNEADAALSGTPLLVEVLIAATPYYFKIYPTKT